ncbi:MAG: hydrogenase maturation nickel metallochaperone HypA [Candidatus Brocadiaceae bacterium]|uniref:hydrogenase maturation nickel metallochaperone HypA/HybF n=1 Tax=Candidatus Wunengus sp. YC61 TaxID=3367698 RepID=UPI0027229E0A|nr:hydrogenase maturation nickel metallochaperone HypA [Candidatus Brocadiaceae bacterium]
MHEFSLIKALIRKISSIALEQHASKVISVTVKLGALSHISPDHLREHFVHASQGTISEGAQLHINILNDINVPMAQDVTIENIEVIENS